MLKCIILVYTKTIFWRQYLHHWFDSWYFKIQCYYFYYYWEIFVLQGIVGEFGKQISQLIAKLASIRVFRWILRERDVSGNEQRPPVPEIFMTGIFKAICIHFKRKKLMKSYSGKHLPVPRGEFYIRKVSVAVFLLLCFPLENAKSFRNGARDVAAIWGYL